VAGAVRFRICVFLCGAHALRLSNGFSVGKVFWSAGCQFRRYEIVGGNEVGLQSGFSINNGFNSSASAA
jgi:hypothetical protein